MGYKSPKQHFDQKLKKAEAEKDFERVAELFQQYGSYLELIAEEPKLSTSKELVHVPNGDPTVAEEQEALLNGTIHASLVEMGFESGARVGVLPEAKMFPGDD